MANGQEGSDTPKMVLPLQREHDFGMTERAQTACCHASVVGSKSEAPEQSEDRGVVRGDGITARRI